MYPLSKDPEMKEFGERLLAEFPLAFSRLNSLWRIHRKINAAIHARPVDHETKDIDPVVFLFETLMARNFNAAVLCLEFGYPEQANAIARSNFEIRLNLLYLLHGETEDISTKAQRYNHYVLFENLIRNCKFLDLDFRELDDDKISRSSAPDHLKQEMKKELEFWRLFKERYKPSRTENWTGKTVAQRLEIIRFGSKTNIEKAIYANLSGHTHSGVEVLDSAISGKNGVLFTDAPSSDKFLYSAKVLYGDFLSVLEVVARRYGFSEAIEMIGKEVTNCHNWDKRNPE
jgi:hypothetical protein